MRANISEILRTISHPRTLPANIPENRKGFCLFYNPHINFHIAHKTAHNQKASVDMMAMLRAFLLPEKDVSTMKDRMCKVRMTVSSSAVGFFFSFERLASYFKVSKHSILNSLLYKMTQFKFA